MSTSYILIVFVLSWWRLSIITGVLIVLVMVNRYTIGQFIYLGEMSVIIHFNVMTPRRTWSQNDRRVSSIQCYV